MYCQREDRQFNKDTMFSSSGRQIKCLLPDNQPLKHGVKTIELVNSIMRRYFNSSLEQVIEPLGKKNTKDRKNPRTKTMV